MFKLVLDYLITWRYLFKSCFKKKNLKDTYCICNVDEAYWSFFWLLFAGRCNQNGGVRIFWQNQSCLYAENSFVILHPLKIKLRVFRLSDDKIGYSGVTSQEVMIWYDAKIMKLNFSYRKVLNRQCVEQDYRSFHVGFLASMIWSTIQDKFDIYLDGGSLNWLRNFNLHESMSFDIALQNLKIFSWVNHPSDVKH